MDLQTRKLNLISLLTGLQDERIISRLEKFLSAEQESNRGPELQPFSKEEFVERILQSEADFTAGKIISQDELEKSSVKW